MLFLLNPAHVLAEQATAPSFDFDWAPEPQQRALATSLPASLSTQSLTQPSLAERLTEMQAKKRRVIFNAHQIIGFSLLGLMALNTVLGHLNYYDKFMGGGYTQRYEVAHIVTSSLSSLLFVTNGIMALAAPRPYETKLRFDTVQMHRIIMLLLTATMVTQIVLGPVSASYNGQLTQRSLAEAHLALGYISYGLLAAGALVYVF